MMAPGPVCKTPVHLPEDLDLCIAPDPTFSSYSRFLLEKKSEKKKKGERKKYDSRNKEIEKERKNERQKENSKR